MKLKHLCLLVCLLVVLITAGAVSASQDNITGDELTVNEDIDVESSNDNEVISANSDNEINNKENENVLKLTNYDELSANGEFIDVNDVYAYLNLFRTGNGAWQWNEDGKTKTIFNTDSSNKLKPLARDLNLEATAKIRAKELAKSFSHVRPDGTLCFTAFPDGILAGGENIAYGPTSCYKVIEHWKENNNPYSEQGHRRNMLNSNYNAVGIAAYKINGVIYWVQDFGNSNNINPAKIDYSNANKVPTKIIAKKATFKSKKKSKYSITLKSGKKAVKKVAVYLKIGKKTYKATTKSNGKSIFNIKLNKKGTYKAKITFKGNKNYNKAIKTVQIKIK